MDRIFKAHIKGTPEEYQTLQKHSTKTADLCEAFSGAPSIPLIVA